MTLFYKIIAIFLILYCFMLGVIIFGSVRFLSKKSNQIEIIFFWKKNRNRTETGSNRPVSVQFGFLGKNRFKLVWLGFSGFGSVFFSFGSVFFGLARFFRFGSVLARFFFLVFCQFRFGLVFFGFLFIKSKPNRTGWFFKKINRFFFQFDFFSYFFSNFLSLIDFPVFFSPLFHVCVYKLKCHKFLAIKNSHILLLHGGSTAIMTGNLIFCCCFFTEW